MAIEKGRKDFPIHANFLDEIPAPLIDINTTGAVVTTFVGWSFFDTKTSDKGWRIAKIVETTAGADVETITEYADGNFEFDNIWDDRKTSVRYSR